MDGLKVGDAVTLFYNDTSGSVSKIPGYVAKANESLVILRTRERGEVIIFTNKIVRIERGADL